MTVVHNMIVLHRTSESRFLRSLSMDTTREQQRPWVWIQPLHLAHGWPWIGVHPGKSRKLSRCEQDQLLISTTVKLVHCLYLHTADRVRTFLWCTTADADQGDRQHSQDLARDALGKVS